MGRGLRLPVDEFGNRISNEEFKLNYVIDFAELQAERQIPMKMADWLSRLDAFLQFNEYQILKDAGKVSHAVAMKLAEKEYEKFRVTQDKNYVSDFDKEVKKISNPSKKEK